tara:strand:+ start:11837 stop:12361 length:525 start_codon:yes stop_codon:yes gene_type:complete
MQKIISALFLALGGLLFSQNAGAKLSAPIIMSQVEVDSYDLDILARTLWGEARGEGYQGMQGVANVIMNRFAQSQASTGKRRQFGATVAEVCQKKYQFSAWNVSDPNYSKLLTVTENNADFKTARAIAYKALAGTLSDITGGADHYHTAAVNPNWSRGVQPIAVIQNHQFYKLA